MDLGTWLLPIKGIFKDVLINTSWANVPEEFALFRIEIHRGYLDAKAMVDDCFVRLRPRSKDAGWLNERLDIAHHRSAR